MNTYIFRTVATILGVPVVAFLLLQAYFWYENLREDHTLAALSSERIQFPLHHRWAQGALERFGALTPDEQAEMRALVRQSIQGLESWLEALNRQDVALICLGENHDGHLRRMIAERILSRFPTDILMLEGDRTDAARLLRHSPISDYVPLLLGVDMSPVIRAVKHANPEARVLGIEETAAQFKGRKAGDGSARDGTIEQNLRAVYQPGKRHIVLYGAFHCSHNTQRFYNRLNDDFPGLDNRVRLNVRVAREHIEAPVEAFMYFLDEIGLPRRDIVITDPAALVRRFREWFPFFTTNELDHFSKMIIMRPGDPNGPDGPNDSSGWGGTGASEAVSGGS